MVCPCCGGKGLVVALAMITGRVCGFGEGAEGLEMFYLLHEDSALSGDAEGKSL